MLGELSHKLVMAGKQIWNRGGLLAEAIKKCDLSALFLFDRRQILLSTELPQNKQRWGESHEIGHSIIPWHEDLCHGDQSSTLSVHCQAQLELEANYAAGQLLFLRNRFATELWSSPVCFESIKKLAKRYNNSIASTLWRAVESSMGPAFGIIGGNPAQSLPAQGCEIRHFIRSSRFQAEFPGADSIGIYRALAPRCSGLRGLICNCLLVMADLRGERHEFSVECFSNTHDVLTLGIWRRVVPVQA